MDRSIFAITLTALAIGGPMLADPRMPARGYAPVNGLQLYFEVHGKPGPGRVPLVLLHGGGSTMETSFGKLLPEFARNRQVILFDQQGHGRTADVDRPFSFEQSAEDAVALLRHLKVSRADFLGFSNGGHIGIEVALRHPEVVRRLVIESAMFARDGADPQFWAGFDDAKLATMPKQLQKAYLESSPRPDLQSFFDKSVARMRAFKGWTEEQIHSIRAPTLVLCGDRDVLTPEHAVRMYRLLPVAELAILPATSHMEIEAREEVPTLVSRFLNE